MICLLVKKTIEKLASKKDVFCNLLKEGANVYIYKVLRAYAQKCSMELFETFGSWEFENKWLKL
jgi:hypothetical protein